MLGNPSDVKFATERNFTARSFCVDCGLMKFRKGNILFNLLNVTKCKNLRVESVKDKTVGPAFYQQQQQQQPRSSILKSIIFIFSPNYLFFSYIFFPGYKSYMKIIQCK